MLLDLVRKQDLYTIETCSHYETEKVKFQTNLSILTSKQNKIQFTTIQEYQYNSAIKY